jgi:calcineurin-like phosphoesterase
VKRRRVWSTPVKKPRREAGGTAYMTDAGMTGDYDSISSMQKDEPMRRFTSGIPSTRFEPALPGFWVG